MRRGIHRIACPYLLPVLIEDDPFAVANTVGARENFVMPVGTVQREGRVWRGPVLAEGEGRDCLWHAYQARCGVTGA